MVALGVRRKSRYLFLGVCVHTRTTLINIKGVPPKRYARTVHEHSQESYGCAFSRQPPQTWVINYLVLKSLVGCAFSRRPPGLDARAKKRTRIRRVRAHTRLGVSSRRTRRMCRGSSPPLRGENSPRALGPKLRQCVWCIVPVGRHKNNAKFLVLFLGRGCSKPPFSTVCFPLSLILLAEFFSFALIFNSLCGGSIFVVWNLRLFLFAFKVRTAKLGLFLYIYVSSTTFSDDIAWFGGSFCAFM